MAWTEAVIATDFSTHWRLLAATALFAVTCYPAAARAQHATITGTARIVDGDTLDVGAVRVRLHGIDAPEAGQTCEGADGRRWQCGTEVMNRLAELAEGKTVECDALDRDPYGRIIARCRRGSIDLNGTMIDEGLAWAFLRFSTDFADREAAARAARIGIWQGEAEPPWDYRENRWARAVAASPGGCPIKGNISGKGKRIYHTP